MANPTTISNDLPTGPSNPPSLGEDQNVLTLYAELDAEGNWAINCDGTELGESSPDSPTITMSGSSKVALIMLDPPGYSLTVCSTWKSPNSNPKSSNTGVTYPRTWSRTSFEFKAGGDEKTQHYSYASFNNLLPTDGEDGDEGDSKDWDIDIAFIATATDGTQSRCDPVFKIKVQRPA